MQGDIWGKRVRSVDVAESLVVSVALVSLANFVVYTLLYPDTHLALLNMLTCTISVAILVTLRVLRRLDMIRETLKEILERLESEGEG
jgi:hypothetical protein